MHIRSMHNKRMYIHPLFTLPGQRLYISGECARLCLHRRDPLHGNLGADVCVSSSFFLFFFSVSPFFSSRNGGGGRVSLDRDDFFAALRAYYSGHVPTEASLIEFSSEPRQPTLYFPNFFSFGGGNSVGCSISKGENLGRVCLSRRIEIFVRGSGMLFFSSLKSFEFRSIRKKKNFIN